MTVYALMNQLHSKRIKLWQEDGQLKFKAPKGAFTDSIREQLVSNKSDIIAFLQQVSTASKIPPIAPVNKAEIAELPLSFSQERLWFIDQLDPGSSSYNIPVANIFKGEFQVGLLRKAFNIIIERHDNLRTVFPSHEGQAQQKILDSLSFLLEEIDLSHYKTNKARHVEAKKLCQAEASTPFDLATGPLIRGMIIKLAQQENIFMLNMHHIISDGWSMGVLLKEFGLIMKSLSLGQEIELTPLPIQYFDYSVWQRKMLQDCGILELQLTYWKDKLSGVPESLDLATDFPRPGIQSFAGASYKFTLDNHLTEKLKALAERNGCTLYMTLLSIFKVLLYRYSNQKDICVGGVIANRQYGETECLIGMFINTLALRSHLNAEESFESALAKVKTTCLEAYEHQDTPFEKVVDLVQPHRNVAMNPLYQIMFILQNAPLELLPNIQPYSLDSVTSHLDQIFEFTESAQGLDGLVEYSTALFKHETIKRLVRHFTALCQAIVTSPKTEISRLDYISDKEKQRLIVDFNQTQIDYRKDKCIHQLFVEQVDINPDKIAVEFEEDSLTYRQLHDKSHTLALYLQSVGVKPDILVGLCMDRSLEMMVSILAILQAGGAYVPMDPDYPDERLQYMLANSQANIVLTQAKYKDKLTAIAKKTNHLIVLDQQWNEISQSVADMVSAKIKLKQGVKPNHLAYLIYTSGSTGRPKGVMVEHRALMNRIEWMQKQYPLMHQDIVLQKTPFSFDVSVWEFLWPMMSGSSVVFAKPGGHKDVQYLENLINCSKVTTLHFVPSMLNTYLSIATQNSKSVRRIFCSGEALEKSLVDKYKIKFSKASLYNLYGPTEAAIDVTAYDCSLLNTYFVPIGTPIANTQIYILDELHTPQPVGIPGELYIAGDGLARGYLNHPELTKEKFVRNPFNPSTRMYKSGDLARWSEDGSIEYLGRIDTQVKIRGFRIEMGEIEAQLNQHPDITNSVVVVQGNQDTKKLVAFYVTKKSTSDNEFVLTNEELTTHIQNVLPEYMLPSAFVSLDAIPVTSNGKADRHKLEKIDVSLKSSQAYLAPRNEIEKQIQTIWGGVLNLEPVSIGINDNFFELGGNSLLAVKLIAKINSKFKSSIPVTLLFTAPSIIAIAQLISSKKTDSFNILVPLQTQGSSNPIFAMPGADGNVLSLQQLSRSLGNNQPFYGMQAAGLDGKTAAFNSVEETAKANINAIKTIQPLGPYSLVGYSYGGVVAFEVARMFLEQGMEVACLILLDTLSPSIMQQAKKRDEISILYDGCTSVARSKYGVNLSLDKTLLQRISKGKRYEYIANLFTSHGIKMTKEELKTTFGLMQSVDKCLNTYQPSKLTEIVEVTLFRSTEGEQVLPEDYGWNEYLLSPIKTYDIAANHYSLIDKIPINNVAKKISTLLSNIV